jgi:hypothetical protein
VIAKLNRGARDQNRLAERRSNSFQVRAVEKWLALHTASHRPQELSKRILKRDGLAWDASSQLDMETLRMLSRYCFRCHSSMFYNVFDKAGLLEQSSRVPNFQRNILASKIYLLSPADPQPFMPQGRKLEELEKQKLIKFLESLTK